MNKKRCLGHFSVFLIHLYHFSVQDKKAHLIIHSYVDDVMKELMQQLNLTISLYTSVRSAVEVKDEKADVIRDSLDSSIQTKSENELLGTLETNSPKQNLILLTDEANDTKTTIEFVSSSAQVRKKCEEQQQVYEERRKKNSCEVSDNISDVKRPRLESSLNEFV